MYQFEWEKTSEGTIKILRLNEMESEPVLPEKVEGLPLTEVGPYCFSGNKYLERMILPDSIKKIDRMAFYNCTSLCEIEMGPGLVELGGDAFMNCHKLYHLKIRCDALEKNGARLILSQISSDLCVEYIGGKKREKAKILFPEYYETYDEVAPAHLFGRNIEGEGFRARQCFKEGVFEYSRYDGIFQKACAKERVETLCEMALNRLMYPINLEENEKIQYETFIKQHIKEVSSRLVKNRDILLLRFLCEKKLIKKPDLEQLMSFASAMEWVEGTVLMFRFKEEFFSIPKGEDPYTFEDF